MDNENTAKAYAERPESPISDNCEHEPASVENRPQDGAEHKAKKQLRADAAYRVLDCRYDTTADIVREIVNWGHEPHTGEELRHALIDLLTDDDYGTMEAETSQVPEHDTREQLEADIHEYLSIAFAKNKNTCGLLLIATKAWLNRQAAITERETRLRELYRFEENHRANIDATEEINRKLNERIAELTAERDELNMRINGLVGELGDTEGTALSLQAKCDDLRSRLKTQANNFAKLERDNAKLRDTLARVRGLVGDAK